jgi:hypothetical protein
MQALWHDVAFDVILGKVCMERVRKEMDNYGLLVDLLVASCQPPRFRFRKREINKHNGSFGKIRSAAYINRNKSSAMPPLPAISLDNPGITSELPYRLPKVLLLRKVD